jgi:uncharacterized membrane protein YccC
MKWVDRSIGTVLLASVAAIALSTILPSLMLATVVITVCIVVVRVVFYFTGRW